MNFKASSWIFPFLLFSTYTGYASAGDVNWAAVETNGWVLQIGFEAMGTGGSWNFGFDTNSTPTDSNRVILTLTSVGYAADTSETAMDRVLRGTKQLRMPYPNQTQNDVQSSGADAVARIALDDFVFSNCTNLTLTVKAGLYSSGGKASKEAVRIVTNNSLLAHPRSIAKWSWPPYWRITNETYQLRCVAFHRSGMNHQPVRAVKFWGVCEDGTTNEPVIVTNATIDAVIGDAVPIVEYIATLSATNFASSKWVTNHFAVFPWVGDSNAVTRTDDGVNSAPSPYYAPYPLLCDRSNTYGVTIAVVATNGSDSLGRAINSTNWNSDLPPAAFRTVNAAVVAIKNTNTAVYTRTDAGAGVIYLREGEYSWTGGTSPRGPTPKTWLMLDAFPGATWTNIVFTNRGSSSGFASGMDLIHNIKFKTSIGGDFRNLEKLWLNQIHLESSEVSSFSLSTNVWITSSTLVTNGSIGLDYLPPAPTTFHLIRGCRFTKWGGSSRAIQAHTVIGNLRLDDVMGTSNSTPSIFANFGKPPKDSKDIIVAFNKFYYLAASGTAPVNWYRGGETSSCEGMVVAQNLMEIHKSSRDIGAPLVAVSWSGSSSTITQNRVNNVLIWNNTFVGNRCNLGDDAAGNGLDGGLQHDRLLWSVRNNIFASCNTKHDTEYTPNGGRIYGWPILYGVGWSGNLDQRLNVDCSWYFQFFGVPGYQFKNCNDSRTNWPGYVSYKGFQGGTNYGAGGGDYHLTGGSPAVNYPVVHMLPYDIEGTDRSLGDASGAYAYPKDPPNAVLLINPSITEAVFSVSAVSRPGRLYILESSDDLSTINWNSVIAAQGTGDVITLIDSNVVTPRKFYRVLQK